MILTLDRLIRDYSKIQFFKSYRRHYGKKKIKMTSNYMSKVRFLRI